MRPPTIALMKIFPVSKFSEREATLVVGTSVKNQPMMNSSRIRPILGV
jgi:hypothetical protein